MEKKEILSFNRQIARMYTLAIANIMLSVTGLALNYFQFNHNKILYIGIALNFLAIVFYQPWKIMRGIRELFACQRMLEELTKTKGDKNYV